ncbi:hypothetical protein EC988_003120, partial [Linderina pennispora]
MDIASLFSVSNKTFVITGGATGIGLMAAEGLVVNGANVYITSRNEENLKRESERLTASGPGRCQYVVCDLLEYDQVEALAGEIARREPNGIHVLINNAVLVTPKPFIELTESDMVRDITITLQRPLTLVQKFLPLLLKTATDDDPARVINVTSISAVTNLPITNTLYPSCKAGLAHMTRDLAQKLAPYNVNVNAFAPGVFVSKLHEQQDERYKKTVKSAILLKRLGNKADVASAIIYLSSTAGAYVTGTTMLVDGGMF